MSMPRRKLYLLLLVPLLLIGGALTEMARGQTTPALSFELLRTLGQVPPRGIVYEPIFDRFAWVDEVGRLQLVDAATLRVQHTLYEGRTYNGYVFSHDGTLLALAIDTRVEIWDANSGVELAEFYPEGAKLVTPPLFFSDDDTFLSVNSVVPAPQAIRRSENDVTNLPWLWDVAAARDLRRAALPGRVTAQPFYDYRNGFFFGPNNLILAALPDRIQLITPTDSGFPVALDVPTDRFEQDPVDLWYSLRGDQMYFRPKGGRRLLQIQTDTARAYEIYPGRELDAADLRAYRVLALEDDALIIGQPNTLAENSFLRLLLGAGYIERGGTHPLTVMLLDVLTPVTSTADPLGLLVFIMDDTTGRGVLDVIRPGDVDAIAFHPDGRQVAVRRASGSQPVEVYDLTTGALTMSLPTAYPLGFTQQVLAYNAAGTVLTVGWQRFDAATGALLFENLNFNEGFGDFLFNSDSASIVTLNGDAWWVWDIPTGSVVRRERLNLLGDLWVRSDDGQRYLTRVYNDAGDFGVELVDVGRGARQTVYFQTPPGRSVLEVLYSPNWDNYLVTYSPAPGGGADALALYNLYRGQLWFMEGDDLPQGSRQYGWVDNDTIYVFADAGSLRALGLPFRLYGLQYHASGLPQCLVDGFPDAIARWGGLWERLLQTLSPNQLAVLTARLCGLPGGTLPGGALPGGTLPGGTLPGGTLPGGTLPDTVDGVNAIFFPTATATRIPVTAAPPLVAGVPACLTQAFAGQALNYAQQWRDLTANLPVEQVAELETWLCEELARGNYNAIGSPVARPRFSTTQVMVMNLADGTRAVGSFVPAGVQDAPSFDLVLDEFSRTMGFYPADARLSPDRTLLAVRTPMGYVAVYRLLVPYETLAARATATAIGAVTQQPNVLALVPTATLGFTPVGGPRATFTPTVTPTSPPFPTQLVPLPNRNDDAALCGDATRYSLPDGSLPAGFAPTGRLMLDAPSRYVWWLDMATGHAYPDDTLPCANCGDFSADGRWRILWGDDVRVERADGSVSYLLYSPEEQSAFPDDVRWVNGHVVEIRAQIYVTGYRNPQAVFQRLDVNTGVLTPPQVVSAVSAPLYNGQLFGEIVTVQPDDGTLALVRLAFDSGGERGYRYFLYDLATRSYDYFARIPYGDLEYQWHPRGTALYYRYPDDSTWYVVDAATRQQYVLGALPDGVWTPDLRYRLRWDFPSYPLWYYLMDHGDPVPQLALWDSATGATRRYCVPHADGQQLDGVRLVWSPDGRYAAFYTYLPEETWVNDVFYPRLFVLDTQTGAVVDYGFDVPGLPVVWDESQRSQP